MAGHGGKMKVLGLVFSAREKGNCYHCVNYCLEKFKENGFETQLVNAYDYEIKPCSQKETRMASKSVNKKV